MAYRKQTWRDYDDTKTELVNMDRGAVVTPERMNHIETGIANSADKNEVTAQLAQTNSLKVGGGVKLEPEDASQRTLELWNGGTVEINSIPQDESVDEFKTTYIDTKYIETSEYVAGKINNNSLVPNSGPAEKGVVLINKIPRDTKIRIVKDTSDRFVVGLKKTEPEFVGNNSLKIIKNDNVGSEFVFDSADNEWLVVYVSFNDARPSIKLQVIEDTINFNKDIFAKNMTVGKNLSYDTVLNNFALTISGEDVWLSSTPSFDNAVYIKKVEPNTTYTISKTPTKVMRIGSYDKYPVGAGKVLFTASDINVNECTVTTLPTTQYLAMYLRWNEEPPQFIQVEKGSQKTEWETPGYKFSPQVTPYIYNPEEDVREIHPSTSKAEFIKEMNKRAEMLNMTDTVFVDGHGGGLDNVSSAKDLIKLGLYALSNPLIMNVFGRESWSFEIGGIDPRTHTSISTVVKPELNDFYPMFGGKTGTGYGNYNLLSFVEGENSEWLLGVTLGENGNQRHLASKQMFDIAVAKQKGEDVSSKPFIGESGYVIKVPSISPVSYATKEVQPLFNQNENTVGYIASVTKLMTVLVATDYLKLNERMTVIESDIVNWTDEDKFPVGDIVTVRDAIYSAMLESSNTFATMLSRYAGTRIIELGRS